MRERRGTSRDFLRIEKSAVHVMAERMLAEDLRDPYWHGVVLPMILEYLQLISPQRQGGGQGEEAQFGSLTASLCFTMALIVLAAARPLPPSSSTVLKFCIFFLILGCASLLSLALPKFLSWLPYFSIFRPFFHLLPRRFQLRILQFSRTIWGALKRLVTAGTDPFHLRILQFFQTVSDATQRLVAFGGDHQPLGGDPLDRPISQYFRTVWDAIKRLVTVVPIEMVLFRRWHHPPPNRRPRRHHIRGLEYA